MTEKIMTPIEIIGYIEEDPKRSLEPMLQLYSSPNVKGEAIEGKVREFFERYLGSFLDFYTRVCIVDSEGTYTKVFENYENEFDIVGIFKVAIPHFVIKCESIIHVPIDSVGLVIEVGKNLSKEKLKHDLLKLQKINMLKVTRRAPLSWVSFEFKFPYPYLRVLFYGINNISIDTLMNFLNEYIDSWKFLLVLYPKTFLAISPSILKIIYSPPVEKIAIEERYPLIKTFVLIIKLLPKYMVVDSSEFFLNAFQE